VNVSSYKQGIRTLISGRSYSRAAGVRIQFNQIGRNDVYSVVTLRITGVYGEEKTLRALCINRHLDIVEKDVVEGALYSGDLDSHEVNSFEQSFPNGVIVDGEALRAMRDSGSKYALYMNGYVIIVVKGISETTALQDEVVIRTEANVNPTLRDRYAEAAGGSIVTFNIESGFMQDAATYMLRLDGDATRGMSVAEQSKWTDGKKVFCYLVDKNKLDDIENGGSDSPLVGAGAVLFDAVASTALSDGGEITALSDVRASAVIPVEISDGAICIETDGASFDAEQQMLMLTLEEIPLRNVTFDTGGGSLVDAQNVYAGDCADEPEPPIKEGYRFTGWFTDSAWLSAFDFASPILNDTTLYARWTKRTSRSNQIGESFYNLAAFEIDRDTLAEQFGEDVDPADIRITVSAEEPSGEMIQIVEDAAEAGGFVLMVPAVEFKVTCTYEGKTVVIERFNAYVERRIAIPDDVDPDKITTAVVVNPDGTLRHVPTKIELIDGKYYAVINSRTNSVYALVHCSVDFTDIQGHWAENEINDMASRKIISGHPVGTFLPDGAVNRAEFAAILVRALGLPENPLARMFSDVTVDDWFCGAVQAAADYGVVRGCTDGSFMPNARVTQEQAMAMLERAGTVIGLDENSKLQPEDLSVSDSHVTRAEAAVIVRRLLQEAGLI